MFSAFSFGKIIKTILPGSILAGALILLAEGIWQLTSASGDSLVAKLASKEWLTAVAAALVPLSMILGFLLNTWVWMSLNKRMRSQVDAELSSTIFPHIRSKLSAELWTKIRRYLTESGGTLPKVENPPRESLEYFYLPLVSLERLNYLWESYFSWYEFQINTAVALGVSTPFTLFLLGVKMVEHYPALFFILVLGFLVGVYYLCRGLWRAARKNLAEYEKDLMLLIAGSLTLPARPAGSET